MASFSHAERDAVTFRCFSARVVSGFAANPPAFCLENEKEPCYRPVKPSITAEFKRTLAGRSAAELPRMVEQVHPTGATLLRVVLVYRSQLQPDSLRGQCGPRFFDPGFPWAGFGGGSRPLLLPSNMLL